MMNDNLIQTLSNYTSTLEQQLAALETRVAQLEELLADVKKHNDIANQQIATLQAEIVALTAAQTCTSETEEPEVEIKLILDEEVEEETAEETVVSNEEIIEENAEKEIEPTIADTTEDSPVEEPKEYTSQTIDLQTCESKSIEPAIETKETEQEDKIAEEEVAETMETAAEPQPTHAKSSSTPQPTLCGPAVSDIRQAISLGDRFLFQRELFAGNGEQMQKTLEELNGLHTLSEAMTYIQEHFDWDMESTAASLFVNVLKRRFS